MLAKDDVNAIAHGTHGDPFAVLGMHVIDGAVEVRAFLPQASLVELIDARSGTELGVLTQIDPAGFFAARLSGEHAPFPYRLRLQIGGVKADIDDAYRFGPILGDLDLQLIGEGNHFQLFDKLGAHPMQFGGVDGVAFAVWAPNAKRVSVVGSFNDWDGRRHPMRRRGASGVWEIFVPGVPVGSLYKYELLASDGSMLPLKSDPIGFAAERTPATASVVARAGKETWNDAQWMARRGAANDRSAPIAIYEVHLGSWRRAEGNRYLTYAELADQLVPYVASLGFTHIELLPITEHPFDGSWGYQPIGMYAPTSRFGSPADFAELVERAHDAGIGVLLDWVPGHFPTDAHGLALFDGTHLYEHADPRQGLQPDWNTLVYNFGRNEVANYLIANALFWLQRYHIDGVRVDAVASMLYLDYSRKAGEWVPNEFGGRENLAAIRFLQRCNELAFSLGEGATTIAEESTAFPGVSHPVYTGGLGFGFKWNMGWMHDTLAYLAFDPLFRSYHQDELTFSFMYAFSENFLLPFSHDEVVHGKGSLIRKMPGDEWQRFANLRAAYGYMYGHPGKKLLFMGCEFAQDREWNHDRSLDWHLLDDPRHAGMQRLVRDLNLVYRATPALYERDCEADGLEWIESDRQGGVIAFARRGENPDEVTIVVTNFTPVVRHGYRLGVPLPGNYAPLLNTDDAVYGGSGVAPVPSGTGKIPAHGKADSIVLTLPPLSVVFLRRH